MNIENLLKQWWKSCTKERKEIFAYLEEQHIVSANDIVKFFEGSIWRASIFRSLKLFQELSIIRSVQTSDKWESYELNHTDHHHEHFNCSDCWECINFESQELCQRIFDEAKKIGFKIQEHNIGVFGTCKNCS